MKKSHPLSHSTKINSQPRKIVAIVLFSGLSGLLAIWQNALFAGNGNSAADVEPGVAVAELFTSQGCSSCPPADELFGEIIRNHPDVVALEYHVDYWDTLVHGNDGSFKDIFSNPDYTLRQHAYNNGNRRLLGRPGVYTPQMVVNGTYATVGSQKQYVDHALANLEPRVYPITVSARENSSSPGATQLLSVTTTAPASALDPDALAWLAIFHVEKETDITGGENNRLTLVNHHVVTELVPIGRSIQEIRKRDAVMGADQDSDILVLADGVEVTLEKGQGCAVLLQKERPGPIYAAGYCDSSIWP